MASVGGKRSIGAILVLIGAILMIVAAFVPWYMIEFKVTGGPANGATVTTNSYPGLPSSNGTIQYTCSNLPTGFGCPAQTSYNTAHLNNTGNIAEGGYFMMIAGFVLGLIGAVLGLMARKGGRSIMPAMALAVIAMILAIAAVGLFAVELPTALGNDIVGHSGTGPWSSFFGSNSNISYFGQPSSETWGAAVGWYLAIGAFVVLLVGVIVLLMARREPMQPAPTTPAASPTTTGTPPASPPSQM